MSEEHTITYNLNIDVTEAKRELSDVLTISSRYAAIMREIFGSEDVANATRKVQQFIAAVNMARATWQSFMLATGPVGWLGFGAGLLSTVFGVADLAMEFE